MRATSPIRIPRQSHTALPVVDFEAMRIEHRRADQTVGAGTDKQSRQDVLVEKPELNIKGFKGLDIICGQVGNDWTFWNGVGQFKQLGPDHERAVESHVDLEIEWSLAQVHGQERLVEFVDVAVHFKDAPPIFTAPPPPTRKVYVN